MTDLGEQSSFTECKAVHAPMRLRYSAENGDLNLLKLLYVGGHLYLTIVAFVGNVSRSPIQKIIFSNIPFSVIL